MIERQKKITIGKNVFVVDFPNVGQIITLESTKQALTDNRYGQMAASGVASQYFALDLVDAIAFFQVCLPTVLSHYDMRNAGTASVDKVDVLLKVYIEQIKPWFDDTLKQLRNLTVEEENGKQAGEISAEGK